MKATAAAIKKSLPQAEQQTLKARANEIFSQRWLRRGNDDGYEKKCGFMRSRNHSRRGGAAVKVGGALTFQFKA